MVLYDISIKPLTEKCFEPIQKGVEHFHGFENEFKEKIGLVTFKGMIHQFPIWKNGRETVFHFIYIIDISFIIRCFDQIKPVFEKEHVIKVVGNIDHNRNTQHPIDFRLYLSGIFTAFVVYTHILAFAIGYSGWTKIVINVC